MAGTVAPGKKASKNERVNIAHRVIARKEEQQGGGQIGNKVFVLLLDGRNIEGREEEEMEEISRPVIDTVQSSAPKEKKKKAKMISLD